MIYDKVPGVKIFIDSFHRNLIIDIEQARGEKLMQLYFTTQGTIVMKEIPEGEDYPPTMKIDRTLAEVFFDAIIEYAETGGHRIDSVEVLKNQLSDSRDYASSLKNDKEWLKEQISGTISKAFELLSDR